MEILDLNDEVKDTENKSSEDKDWEDVVDFGKEEQDEKKEGKKGKKSKKKEETSAVREIFSWIFTIAIAVVAAMVIKNYVIINANIPSGSMENTILPGDDIFGFRLAYTFSDPKRGDIVIFNAPDDPSEKYIKRVIGLPGETVTIEDAQVYINGEPLEEDYLKSATEEDEVWTTNAGPYEFKVPEDSYLLLGDNRNGSSDARVWEHTYVSKDAIIGKAILRYYPFNRFGVVK
ncbi:signal peptidase I [Agathobacter sp.]